MPINNPSFCPALRAGCLARLARNLCQLLQLKIEIYFQNFGKLVIFFMHKYLLILMKVVGGIEQLNVTFNSIYQGVESNSLAITNVVLREKTH